jgi:cytochrome c5
VIQQDKQFMTQFAIVVGALVVFTIAMFFLARYLMAVNEVNYGPLIAKEIDHRIEPEGMSATGKVAEASPKATAGGGSAQASGQQTFAQVCSSCHESGAMGAPKFGSKADWAPRIKQGKQTLYQNAITGIGAMPPKGGQPSLSDADVKAAVDYMVAEVSGGGGGQQQATKGGGNKVAEASPKAQMSPGIKVAAARGASPENESTYQAMCSTCHSSGALGAPKITDKAAWQPRIAQGSKVLYSSALNGIGAMPAKGGHPQLSDEQVKAAVDYIVSRVSGGEEMQKPAKSPAKGSEQPAQSVGQRRAAGS